MPPDELELLRELDPLRAVELRLVLDELLLRELAARPPLLLGLELLRVPDPELELRDRDDDPPLLEADFLREEDDDPLDDERLREDDEPPEDLRLEDEPPPLPLLDSAIALLL